MMRWPTTDVVSGDCVEYRLRIPFPKVATPFTGKMLDRPGDPLRIQDRAASHTQTVWLSVAVPLAASTSTVQYFRLNSRQRCFAGRPSGHLSAADRVAVAAACPFSVGVILLSPTFCPQSIQQLPEVRSCSRVSRLTPADSKGGGQSHSLV
jgi:hypothetical protein